MKAFPRGWFSKRTSLCLLFILGAVIVWAEEGGFLAVSTQAPETYGPATAPTEVYGGSFSVHTGQTSPTIRTEVLGAAFSAWTGQSVATQPTELIGPAFSAWTGQSVATQPTELIGPAFSVHAGLTEPTQMTESVGAAFAVFIGETVPPSASDIVGRAFSAFTPGDVLLTTFMPDPTNANPIPVMAVFSAPVSGFELSDIVVGNGVAVNFQTLDAIRYTFDVIPAVPGEVTVDVPENAALFAGDVGTMAAETLRRIYDNELPTITVNTLLSDSATPAITGTVTNALEIAITKVQATVQGHTYVATVVGTLWSADVTDALPDGVYDVQAEATNARGKMGRDATKDELTIKIGGGEGEGEGEGESLAVSNITFTQGPDGTAGTKVDIYYDLVSPRGNCTVSATLSKDGGATFPFSITTATGDIGPNIPPGVGKHIVWHYAADYPDEKIDQAKIRVVADDGGGEGEGEGEGELVAGTLRTFAGIDFVYCPAGTFMMGRNPGEQDSSSEEDPQHQVTLTHAFWMSKYQVTQAQWRAVTGASPSSFSGDNRPVESVSWSDIAASGGFLEKLNASNPGLGFRLPTEAEWEYACRAGTTTRFYWGDDPSYSLLGIYAWYTGNSNDGTKDVGGKLPNDWGLYDMSGNVWEWCQDWWADNYASGAVLDPQGASSGSFRLLRGGSWYGTPCRSANRSNYGPVNRNYGIGFRVVCSGGSELK